MTMVCGLVMCLAFQCEHGAGAEVTSRGLSVNLKVHQRGNSPGDKMEIEIAYRNFGPDSIVIYNPECKRGLRSPVRMTLSDSTNKPIGDLFARTFGSMFFPDDEDWVLLVSDDEKICKFSVDVGIVPRTTWSTQQMALAQLKRNYTEQDRS